MNDTPTPRTDAAANESIVKVHKTSLQLETELTAAREELKAVTEQRDRALQKIKNQTERIIYLEGATNHATGTRYQRQ